jgi:tetratricopeptide (TPR) repeat protein
LQEGLKQIADLINTKFGYRRIRENTRFETIGKKKHPEYEVFQENVELIQSAFKLMDADKGLEEIKVKVEPALAFYHAAAAKYKTGNKDQEKLKHICLYNQALAYYWLEDFDQAEQYALAIQKLDSKDKDARRLLGEIDHTRASLKRANRLSRHMFNVGKT